MLLKNILNLFMPKRTINHKAIHIAGNSHLGLQRKNNEDSYFFLRPNLRDYNYPIGVCDGIGGCQHGEDASSYCSWEIIKAWKKYDLNKESSIRKIKIILKELLNNINQWTYNLNNYSHCEMVGTTLVMGVFFDKRLLLLNIGDSRCYKINKNGKVKLLSKDHSVINELIDSKVISKDEVKNHPLTNVISRAIGGDVKCDVDMKIVKIKPGDKFLFCSDGLSNHINSDIISRCLNNDNTDIEHICQKMIKEALNNNGHDNITAVIVTT